MFCKGYKGTFFPFTTYITYSINHNSLYSLLTTQKIAYTLLTKRYILMSQISSMIQSALKKVELYINSYYLFMPQIFPFSVLCDNYLPNPYFKYFLYNIYLWKVYYTYTEKSSRNNTLVVNSLTII